MHRAAVYALCNAIKKSRVKCWDELLSSLNTDPWGRSYKIVMNRHRAWAAPVMETLELHILNNVVNTLFPVADGEATLDWGLGEEGPQEWNEDVMVSNDEITRAFRKIGSNKAPGWSPGQDMSPSPRLPGPSAPEAHFQ